MQVLTGCDGASGPLPAEVDNGVRASRSGSVAVLTWNVAAGAAEQCLADDFTIDSLADREIPAPGDGFWYLIRGANACGSGPYGFEVIQGALPAPRVSAACP